MIRIEKVVISNFRSYKGTKNDFVNLSDINVIVGKNNVGKTNILRAIYLFFNPESYDIPSDRNMIKQVTGGQARDPKITFYLRDDVLIGEEVRYHLVCNLNVIRDGKDLKEYYYLDPKTTDNRIKDKLSSHKAIKSYLEKNIKCVYLSTTDEDIEKQTDRLIDDLILEYFKKQNRNIKKTVDDFEKQYAMLIKTLQDNIGLIEEELARQFDDMTDMGVTPKLSINPTREITGFLLENIKLQLDDSYIQDIGNKGAGIQRASLILLSLYLLNQIYSNISKVILLDEPEAFLYPLLINRVKSALERNANSNLQIFLTSHAREFLTEMNNPKYSFAYLKQKKEEKEYRRSRTGIEVNKYSVIEPLDRRNKYEVLKNYGLLDEINDYEYVIVCEGESDKNYLLEILRDKPFIPQIRFDRYASSIENKKKDLDYDLIGKGAEAIPHILIYLNEISSVHRQVMTIFDGDKAGLAAAKKIKDDEFENLTIKKVIFNDGKEIEDVLYSDDEFVREVLRIAGKLLNGYELLFEKSIKGRKKDECLIDKMKQFFTANNIGLSEYEVKHKLSIRYSKEGKDVSWLMEEIDGFFYRKE